MSTLEIITNLIVGIISGLVSGWIVTRKFKSKEKKEKEFHDLEIAKKRLIDYLEMFWEEFNILLDFRLQGKDIDFLYIKRLLNNPPDINNLRSISEAQEVLKEYENLIIGIKQHMNEKASFEELKELQVSLNRMKIDIITKIKFGIKYLNLNK